MKHGMRSKQTEIFAASNARTSSHSTALPDSAYEHLDHLQSQLCCQNCSGKTKLRFEYGTNIEFKVLYSTLVLGECLVEDEDEVMATICHAKSVLEEAWAIIRSANGIPVDKKAVDTLAATIATVLQNRDIQRKLHKRLMDYQDKPQWAVDNVALEDWHNSALAFIRHAKVLSSEADLKDLLQATRTAVDKAYHECLEVLERENLIIEPVSVAWTATHDVEVIQVLNEYLPLLGLEEVGGRKNVAERFMGLFRIYDSICTVFLNDTVEKFEILSYSDLASTIKVVAKELRNLLTPSPSGMSLKDQQGCSRDIEILCQGSCHALLARCETDIRSNLINQLDKLYTSLHHNPGVYLEHDFVRFATFLDAFSIATPDGIAEEEWCKYAPRLVSPTMSQNMRLKIQQLYVMYQDRIYDLEETSRLWLAIWRGLSALYLLMLQRPVDLGSIGFPVEAAFFKNIAIYGQLGLVVGEPEPRHCETIEDIVAQYCLLIANCRESNKLEHGMLRQFQTKPISESILASIRTFKASGEWSDVAIRGIEKCAIRLNHILGGPSHLRRCGPQTTSHVSPSQWTIEKITASKSKSSTAEVSAPFDQNLTQRENGKTLGHDLLQPTTGSDLEDTILGCSEAVSAFDYVTYPFPETRPIEVAQSRQISRELSTPGIYSQGALVEDVVNLPPRHTWRPGSVSIWAKSLPIGPLSLVKGVWRSMRKRAPRTKSLRAARPCPSMTSRRPRKEWADEHPRLKPLLDRGRKISKQRGRAGIAKNSANHLQSLGSKIPRLRGGGAPITKPDSNEGSDFHRQEQRPLQSSASYGQTSSNLTEETRNSILYDMRQRHRQEMAQRVGYERERSRQRAARNRMQFRAEKMREDAERVRQEGERILMDGEKLRREGERIQQDFKRLQEAGEMARLEFENDTQLMDNQFHQLQRNLQMEIESVSQQSTEGHQHYSRPTDVLGLTDVANHEARFVDRRGPISFNFSTLWRGQIPIASTSPMAEDQVDDSSMVVGGNATRHHAGSGNSAVPNGIGSNGHLTPSAPDSPGHLQIFEDSPGHSGPNSPRNSPQLTHGNGSDRASSNNSSNQENRTPRSTGSRPPFAPVPPCNPYRCHPCPLFRRTIHHVCQGVQHDGITTNIVNGSSPQINDHPQHQHRGNRGASEASTDQDAPNHHHDENGTVSTPDGGSEVNGTRSVRHRLPKVLSPQPNANAPNGGNSQNNGRCQSPSPQTRASAPGSPLRQQISHVADPPASPNHANTSPTTIPDNTHTTPPASSDPQPTQPITRGRGATRGRGRGRGRGSTRGTGTGTTRGRGRGRGGRGQSSSTTIANNDSAPAAAATTGRRRSARLQNLNATTSADTGHNGDDDDDNNAA